MLKRLYLLVALLSLLVVFVIAHYSMFSQRGRITEAVNQIAEITQMVSLSLGSAYYEPRVRRVGEYGNPVYPEMIPINRMDFVYAR